MSPVREILSAFDDPTREGLVETPRRYMKFLDEFINGADKEFSFTTFSSDGMDEMIVLSGIEFYSMCEHHMVPFFGTATVGYIPKDRIVGLSKLARVVDFYARRFQNQERITSQIVDRIASELDPVGAGAILRANHLCMAMRGVRKPAAMTTTCRLYGKFKTEAICRDEFLSFGRAL